MFTAAHQTTPKAAAAPSRSHTAGFVPGPLLQVAAKFVLFVALVLLGSLWALWNVQYCDDLRAEEGPRTPDQPLQLAIRPAYPAAPMQISARH